MSSRVEGLYLFDIEKVSPLSSQLPSNMRAHTSDEFWTKKSPDMNSFIICINSVVVAPFVINRKPSSRVPEKVINAF